MMVFIGELTTLIGVNILINSGLGDLNLHHINALNPTIHPFPDCFDKLLLYILEHFQRTDNLYLLN